MDTELTPLYHCTKAMASGSSEKEPFSFRASAALHLPEKLHPSRTDIAGYGLVWRREKMFGDARPHVR